MKCTKCNYPFALNENITGTGGPKNKDITACGRCGEFHEYVVKKKAPLQVKPVSDQTVVDRIGMNMYCYMKEYQIDRRKDPEVLIPYKSSPYSIDN